MKLIITADDYGMCASVNAAIEACIAAGTVRSTCVMTNMPDCEPASQLRRRFPCLSVGIHWTLTEGRPLLGPALVPSLVNNGGHFYSASEFRKRWRLGKISKAEIRQELIAQYSRFTELAGVPDYWNTHENVHDWPTLFQLFKTVGKELAIGMMRNNFRVAVPYQKTMASHNIAHLNNYLTNQMHFLQSSKARLEGMAMPAGMLYFPDFPGGQTALEDAIKQFHGQNISAPLELMIHPATQVEPALFGNLMENRVKEYQYFAHPDVSKRLQQLGCSLKGFSSLSKAS
jgi:predicted glycoside hydrolase/deacetylase ChbG (UPF0249 family)